MVTKENMNGILYGLTGESDMDTAQRLADALNDGDQETVNEILAPYTGQSKWENILDNSYTVEEILNALQNE